MLVTKACVRATGISRRQFRSGNGRDTEEKIRRTKRAVTIGHDLDFGSME